MWIALFAINFLSILLFTLSTDSAAQVVNASLPAVAHVVNTSQPLLKANTTRLIWTLNNNGKSYVLRAHRYKYYMVSLLNTRFNEGIDNITFTTKSKDFGDTFWNMISENAPLFDTPDRVLESAYYFRIFTYLRHIKRIPSEKTPYVITEFLNDVPWAGLHNTISCAAGHHFREGRWLHNTTFLDSYARFWFAKDGGNPRQYSFWAADSILAYIRITGNFELAEELLPHLVKNYREIETTNFNASVGLFFNTDNRDGMEFSIGGNSGQRGYRPTLNSYMYGDAKAIAKLAELLEENEIEVEFNEKAEQLRLRIASQLWDSEAKFFKIRSWPDASTLSDVRELHGYTPWYFAMPLPLSTLEAWRDVISPQGFQSKFGLTSAEQRHPRFAIDYTAGTHECQWNGPVWPYGTSVTMQAMANAMNQLETALRKREKRKSQAKKNGAADPKDTDGDVDPRLLTKLSEHLSKFHYFHALKKYASSHHRINEETGTSLLWIDENLDPYNGTWVSREILKKWSNGTSWSDKKGGKERGKDYNHSTFIDLIISGLMGFRPLSTRSFEVNPRLPDKFWLYFCLDQLKYRNHFVTIMWDADGLRYNNGQGMKIYVDGKLLFASDTIKRAVVKIPDPLSS